MASYDLKTLTEVECVQWDGTNDDEVLAVCRDARFDPTEERVARIPATHNRSRVAFTGDWVLSVATGEYLVLPNDSFEALFEATPEE